MHPRRTESVGWAKRRRPRQGIRGSPPIVTQRRELSTTHRVHRQPSDEHDREVHSSAVLHVLG